MFNIRKVFMNKQGFTLIEIIASLAILGILVITFLPIMTGGFSNIVKTGKKTEDLYKAQNTMEISIVDEEVFDKAEIPIEVKKSGSSTWVKIDTIKGGLSESKGLHTFIPLIPAIRIEPKQVDEGYITEKISITGVNTHFVSSSSIKITNEKGYNGSPTSKSITNNTQASFNLPTGANKLTNSGGEYIVTIKTGDEEVKAKLKINLPRFLVTNGQKIGYNLTATDDTLPNLSEIKGTFWEGKRYFAIGNNSSNNGIIYILEDGKPWSMKTINESKSLNSLAYNGEVFVAVGDNGTILNSKDGDNWTKVSETNIPEAALSSNLNSIAWGAITDSDNKLKNIFIVVGDNGIILKSEDGVKWNSSANIPAVVLNRKLNSVTWGLAKDEDNVTKDMFVAAGEKGSVLKTENGTDWEMINLPNNTEKNLNSIVWDGDSFLTVGDKGTIYYSRDSDNWTKHSVNASEALYDLYDICQSFVGDIKEYYIVGNGILMTSEGGTIWSSKITGKKITNIAARY